ncbi:MAG: DUF1835 domain-containing protein [Lachnospiraceae bacterium]|nr:DUF1835 domain-containing protein [Lachnospiraceae bacterium]
MIEVLFGESEAGSMKAAKCTVISKKSSDGPSAVWRAGDKTPPERTASGWIQGTPAEVICLGFLLDIGDIKEPVDSRYRRDLIQSLYRFPEDEPQSETAADVYVRHLSRLEKYLRDGETVRIWYSDAPYSRCGLYHLCTFLRKYENPVHAVKLPEYCVRPNAITLHKNWGEIAAEEFAAFLPYAQALSKQEIRLYASFWDSLAEENSPLRAMVNGRLTSVPEDFYDFLILKELPAEPVMQARLIGRILGRYPLSVGDWWYARRIEHFIREGKIRVHEDAQDSYHRIIGI